MNETIISPLIYPLIWELVGLVFIGLFCALALGMIVGVFTYGRPIKRKRNEAWMDEFLGIGEDLTHVLIDNWKKKRSGGSWLTDGEIIGRLRSMTPNEFEEFVAEMFSAMGYKTHVVGGPGDGGVDIEMEKDGRQYLVQCKKFITQKVTPHDVRDFFGAMAGRWNNAKGFFITTNMFTLAAERWAEDKPIELIDGKSLIEHVRDSGVQSLGGSVASQQTRQEGICPKCGGKLVLRTNRKDGSQFWGCSNYPKCNFTKPL